MFKKIYTNADENENVEELIWITDIHEDACTMEELESFHKIITDQPGKTVLIGGDISNGHKSLDYLYSLVKTVGKPIYFVLGNHDFYGENISKTRIKASNLGNNCSSLCYLTGNPPIPLTASTALIGHDGWADGRVGNFLQSTISLGDYYLINDLKPYEGEELLNKLKQLGDDSAETLKKSLEEALNQFSNIIILTHVPPFREACCYEGHPCDDNWGPHFVCQVMGEMIVSCAAQNPDKNILILSGHSHNKADVQISHNIRVVTGQVTLGFPSIQASVYFS